MGFGSDIRVKILGDDQSLKRAFESARRQAKETEHTFDKTSKSGKGLFSGGVGAAAGGIAAGGAVVVGVLADAAGAALEYDDKLTHLQTAMKNAHISYAQHADDLQKVIDKNIDLGTKENDTLSLLTQGVTSTGSYEKAIKLLSVAQDVAVQTGKPLADAYMAMIKGSEGQIRPLKQLGLDLPIAAGGALKTKVAYEALLKAQQGVTDAQDAAHAGANKKEVADNEAIAKAKQHLTDVEQVYATAKHHTVAQLQAIRNAQDALTKTESSSATSSTTDSARVKAAKDKEAAAEQKLKDVTQAGGSIIDAVHKKTAGAAEAQSKTVIGQYHKEQAEVDKYKRMLGEKVITFIANDLIPDLHKANIALQGFGGHIYDDIIAPVDHAYHSVGDLLDSLATLGVAKPHNDTQAIWARNDARMGWKPGTTESKYGKTAAPKPGDSNFVGPLTPSQQHALDMKNAAAYATAVHNAQTMGPPAPVHIHMHAQPTPAMTKSVLDRHAKRNGRASGDVNRATAP